MSKKAVYLATITALMVIVFPALAHAGSTSFDVAGNGLLWAYGAAFGFGFLTSLTPCVYPMIPIVIGVFGARDEHVTRRKAFALATAYVFGMGAMYAALGVIFALLGKQFGTILANPWVVVPLVAFYLGLAASMFGAFELNLPGSVQNRLNQVGGRGYGGAFGMGLVGGLTAAPCTGPFLAGILAYVAASGSNVFVGASALFVYAMGMGVLFWLIAAFAVSVPKSGRWMESVKSVGGIALVAVAIYFLRPLVPALEHVTDSSIVFLIGAIALVVGGVLVGAVHLSFHDKRSVQARKAFGILLTVAGLTGVVNWAVTAERHLPWEFDEATAFAKAKETDKGVMIDFAATWCLPCKELEAKTFAEPEVFDAIVGGYVPLKFDVSDGTDADEDRQTKYDAETLPAVIFLSKDGTELGRVNKYLAPDEFIATMRTIAEKRKTRASR